ncbi:MAG: hypothetical protein OXC80_07820 [Gammaproteobacteria bacterium]|nr:hypothetical protein [Gammaproteobacteria bacterium]
MVAPSRRCRADYLCNLAVPAGLRPVSWDGSVGIRTLKEEALRELKTGIREGFGHELRYEAL